MTLNVNLLLCYFCYAYCDQTAEARIMQFSPHEAAMLARSWDNNSVRLSVCPTHACFVTKEHTVEVLTQLERVFNLIL